MTFLIKEKGAVPDNAIMCYQNGHAEESIK